MIKFLSATLALALPVTLAAPAIAAPAGLNAPLPDAKRERALQITKLLNDPATFEASASKGFNEGLRASVKMDPQAAAVERAFPGFFEELGAAVLPVFIKLLRDGLPTLWERQADFFVKTYTLPELNQIYAFYSSPVGKRMITLMDEHFDTDAMLDTIDLSAGEKVSIESLDAGMEAGLPKILARLSTAERDALMKFVGTPLGQKMFNNGEALQAISVAWINEFVIENPALKAEVERQALAIIERRKSAK